mgnify:CR=1 FL=1
MGLHVESNSRAALDTAMTKKQRSKEVGCKNK